MPLSLINKKNDFYFSLFRSSFYLDSLLKRRKMIDKNSVDEEAPHVYNFFKFYESTEKVVESSAGTITYDFRTPFYHFLRGIERKNLNENSTTF
jgi:hypothetical protein